MIYKKRNKKQRLIYLIKEGESKCLQNNFKKKKSYSFVNLKLILYGYLINL